MYTLQRISILLEWLLFAVTDKTMKGTMNISENIFHIWNIVYSWYYFLRGHKGFCCKRIFTLTINLRLETELIVPIPGIDGYYPSVCPANKTGLSIFFIAFHEGRVMEKIFMVVLYPFFSLAPEADDPKF
jgi:hypothetical protein